MGISNEQVEIIIASKKSEAPRVTPQMIDDAIVGKEFFRLTPTLTVCVLKLWNGFTVTGQSACVSEANYDQEIGEKIAYTNAKDAIWQLEGYRLASEIEKSKNG